MKTIVEGDIKILALEESIEKPTKTSAFYNPRMQLNRDFSIAAARAYFEPQTASRKPQSRLIKVCEPMSASGVRALRYAKEVRNTQVICADYKRSAFLTIQKNIELNNLKNIFPFHEDALKNLERSNYDLIDIDPFGTPAPFLETALKQINTGGLLGITATDMPAMCGVYPEVAQKRYGGKTLRTDYCYEIGARVLIYAAAQVAKKFKKSVEPLLVLGVDHYIRIFLAIQKPQTASRKPHTGYIYHCFDCGNRKVSEKEEGNVCACGKTMEEAGPLWIGPIYNLKFLENVRNEIINASYGEKHRALKLVDLMIEEAQYPELVSFYDMHKFCKIYHLIAPQRIELIEKLAAQKFKVSRTHFSPLGIRTNASAEKLKTHIKESLRQYTRTREHADSKKL